METGGGSANPLLIQLADTIENNLVSFKTNRHGKPLLAREKQGKRGKARDCPECLSTHC